MRPGLGEGTAGSVELAAVTHLARDWRTLLAAHLGRYDLHTTRRRAHAMRRLAHICRRTP